MGSAWSSTGSSNGGKRNETPEQRQRRLQETYGILIPPSFATPPASQKTATVIPSPTCQILIKSNPTPSLLDYLWHTNPGRRLLQDHMQPGVLLSVGPSLQRSILVSLDTSTIAEESTSLSRNNSSSCLWAGQTFANGSSIDILVPTTTAPSITASYVLPHHFLSVSANVSAWGTGYVASRMSWIHSMLPPSSSSSSSSSTEKATATALPNDDDDDSMHMVSGVWVPFQWNTSTPSRKLPCDTTTIIHAYVGAEYQSSLVALEATIPTKQQYQQLPSISTMVSINVNESPNNTTSPIWLTLKQQQQSSSSSAAASSSSTSPTWIVNLSQILTFDRPILNLLEERAPRVRQTFGWVVQLEQQQQQQQSPLRQRRQSSFSNDDVTSVTKIPTSPPTVSMGAVWQWNRALAIKGVLQNNATFTYALMARRWNHPRMTLSMVNQWNLVTRSHTLVGFGLELETSTDPLFLTSQNSYPNDPTIRGNDTSSSSSSSPPPPPETKVYIPPHVVQK